jgi:thioredoxin reductase (NADPH)
MASSLRKTVIIGSGPAGLTAAIYACRADLQPLLFTGSSFGGQLMVTSDVENFPGFPEPILGPDLMDRMMRQAERLGAEIYREDVVEVNFKTYPFRIKSNRIEVDALSVIIATGATPKRLNLESEIKLMGRGVSNCAVCDAFFFRGKDVAVVGGGDTAMEEATYLTKFANKVTVIHRRDKLRASAALQKEAFSNKKIGFIWNNVVLDIIGEKKVEGVVLKNVITGELTKLKVDGLFVAIGYEPNTSLFRGQIELDEKGYIVTKNETETSVPGVFAAGDVRDYKYRQAVTAAADGCKAALDADKFLKTKEEYISQLQV